mmetsp:Transcript_16542/g.29920  ORF Transcript_16542/g.29920 Transcript_16542/m.29920 type:complete len:85 (-) Transcript_16542:460-714(-)
MTDSSAVAERTSTRRTPVKRLKEAWKELDEPPYSDPYFDPYDHLDLLDPLLYHSDSPVPPPPNPCADEEEEEEEEEERWVPYPP